MRRFYCAPNFLHKGIQQETDQLVCAKPRKENQLFTDEELQDRVALRKKFQGRRGVFAGQESTGRKIPRGSL
jgi:hypothetical protein